jgi:hypothetical protein
LTSISAQWTCRCLDIGRCGLPSCSTPIVDATIDLKWHLQQGDSHPALALRGVVSGFSGKMRAAAREHRSTSLGDTTPALPNAAGLPQHSHRCVATPDRVAITDRAVGAERCSLASPRQ